MIVYSLRPKALDWTWITYLFQMYTKSICIPCPIKGVLHFQDIPFTHLIYFDVTFFYFRVKSDELKTLGLLANFLHRKNNINYLGSIKGVRGFTPGRIPYILRRKGVWNVSRGKFLFDIRFTDFCRNLLMHSILSVKGIFVLSKGIKRLGWLAVRLSMFMYLTRL